MMTLAFISVRSDKELRSLLEPALIKLIRDFRQKPDNSRPDHGCSNNRGHLSIPRREWHTILLKILFALFEKQITGDVWMKGGSFFRRLEVRGVLKSRYAVDMFGEELGIYGLKTMGTAKPSMKERIIWSS
jgi:hypothetical protein